MRMSTAIDGFILALGVDHSPITADNYKRFLREVCAWLGDPPLEEMDAAKLRAFLVAQAERGMSSATVQVYWKCMRSFSRWASEDLQVYPAALDIAAPHVQSKTIIPFTLDEVTKLMKACKTHRDRALVSLLLDTGLRVGEACRLHIRDANLETGTIEVIPFGGGRKSRGRQVYLGRASRRAVWSYLAQREDRDNPSAPLLGTIDGHAFDRSGVTSLLRRIAARAGVNGVHPHKFRHTFAIMYLRNGGDVFTLQRLLGHASLTMVRRYVELADSDLETAHKRASPVDRLRI